LEGISLIFTFKKEISEYLKHCENMIDLPGINKGDFLSAYG